jgi:hypothetical protein
MRNSRPAENDQQQPLWSGPTIDAHHVRRSKAEKHEVRPLKRNRDQSAHGNQYKRV